MASSPIVSILKIEDLTSEDDACKANQDVLYEDEECLIDDEGDDEPMLSTHCNSPKDIPSTSCSYTQQASQNKTTAPGDTQLSEHREIKINVKTKPSQFEAIANFMVAHPDFAKGVIKHPQSRIKSNDMWNELSDILNKNGPPRRGGEGWKKVWCDHKANIRNKLRKNKIYRSEPRGWPKKFYPLSRLERKIAHFLGYIPNEASGHVTPILPSEVTDKPPPSTVNSSTVDEPTQNSADQSDLNIENGFDESSTVPSNRFSPPLSRKCKKELLKTQIENQREYTKHSKKIMNEINENLKGLLKYSIKSFELDQKRYDLEKEKFIYKQKIEAQKHQTDLEKLQLQRDILRLKQETAGLIN